MVSALLLSKYRTVAIALIALAVVALWSAYWISSERAAAVTAYKQQIEQATKQQVIKDEKIVIEAYQSTDAIEQRVDRMLNAEPAQASGGDRLLSVETSAGTAGRSETRADLGTPDKLSDQEIDFIVEHAELLQNGRINTE